MKIFEFTVDELVRVWVKQTIRVEAESIEEIMEHIKQGDLFNYYDIDFDRYEIVEDTMENIEFEYDMVEPEDITELDK